MKDRATWAAVWIIAVGGPVVRAQDVPPRAIEAASIRPAAFPSDSYFQGWTSFGGICVVGARTPAPSGNRLTLPKMTLCSLIAMAYDVQDYRISGAPAWMMKVEQSNYYDVQIKAEGADALSLDQARGLLRTLLADRFQLKLHHDTKTFPIYELAVAKSGSKLKEVLPGDPARTGVSIRSFLVMMSDFVDRPVIDKTGLTGTHYQSQFDTKELREQLAEGIKPVPSVFHAVEEQLGLTLKPANDSMDVVVIDRAEKPSAN
jgi:uncharacterized protein (TIGR03435 family)